MKLAILIIKPLVAIMDVYETFKVYFVILLIRKKKVKIKFAVSKNY